MNMEVILFSKADKIKMVTFAAVAYGLPWLFVPWVRPEGNEDIMTSYNILGTYMMILPTFGIVLGRIICERKIRRWFQWLYMIAFIGITAVMVLCAAKGISGETANNMTSIFCVGLGIVLFLGGMIDEQEFYPFKNLKKVIGIYIIFVAITQIGNLPLIMRAGALNTIGEIASELLLVPVNILVVSGICFLGEEYAWRGCLQGKLQNIFGKRRGVILLGIVWELWHMPLWVMIYGPGQWKRIVWLVSARMLYVVGLSVFFGWAYMKTKNIWCCVLLHGVNNEAASAFDWMSGGDAAESINPFDLSAVSFFDYIMTFIAVIIMLFFLVAKEYRKEGKV